MYAELDSLPTISSSQSSWSSDLTLFDLDFRRLGHHRSQSDTPFGFFASFLAPSVMACGSGDNRVDRVVPRGGGATKTTNSFSTYALCYSFFTVLLVPQMIKVVFW
jgi:hypothetical protein